MKNQGNKIKRLTTSTLIVLLALVAISVNAQNLNYRSNLKDQCEPDTNFVGINENCEKPQAFDKVVLYNDGGYAKLSFINNTKDPVDILVYDLQGRLVYRDRSERGQEYVEKSYYTGVSHGIHIVKLRTKGEKHSTKLPF